MGGPDLKEGRHEREGKGRGRGRGEAEGRKEGACPPRHDLPFWHEREGNPRDGDEMEGRNGRATHPASFFITFFPLFALVFARTAGYAWPEDKEHCEEFGRMLQADSRKVSDRAKKRGLPQVRPRAFDSPGPWSAGPHLLPPQTPDIAPQKSLARSALETTTPRSKSSTRSLTSAPRTRWASTASARSACAFMN